jgi:hypothetical protein
MCQDVLARRCLSNPNFWQWLTGFLTWWILMTTSQMETRAGWEAQHRTFQGRRLTWHSNKWHNFPPKMRKLAKTLRISCISRLNETLFAGDPRPLKSSGLAAGGTQEPDIRRLDISPPCMPVGSCHIVSWYIREQTHEETSSAHPGCGLYHHFVWQDKTMDFHSAQSLAILLSLRLCAEVWCNPIWFGVCVYI